MGRKKIEVTQGPFQIRFRDLFREKCRSQEELANAIGVSRPTVAGWLDGNSIPNIDSLEKLSRFFGVSADYLLGLSDTVRADVNLRVAVEYTGLSEEAVERLHDGFYHPENEQLQKSEVEKRVYLSAISALIVSREFENMVSSFSEAAKWAFLEKTMVELLYRRSEADLAAGKSEANPISEEERDRIMAELLQTLNAEGFYVPEHSLYRLQGRIADCLSGGDLYGLLDIRESVDRHQFLASKAIMNYIALLGWSPSDNTEIFSLKELEEKFDIAGLSKSPSIFDIKKLTWMNSEYLKNMDFEKYFELAQPKLEEALGGTGLDYRKIAALLQKRLETLNDIPGLVAFFKEQPEYSTELYTHKKMKTNDEIALASLQAALPVLEGIEDWNTTVIHDTLMALVGELGIKNGQLLWPVRTALSGEPTSPGGAMELADILGKEESIRRIKKGIELLSK